MSDAVEHSKQTGEEQHTAEKQTSTPTVKKKKTWPLLLLAGLLIAAAAAYVWQTRFVAKPQTMHSASQRLHQPQYSPPVPMHTVRTPKAQPTQATTQHTATASQRDNLALEREIKALRQALAQTLSSHQEDSQRLQKQEELLLHTRLRWISAEHANLEQIRLAWEDIATLSFLSAQERQSVLDMRQLAQNTWQDSQHWRKQLQDIVKQLSPAEAQPWFSPLQYPWLAWMGDSIRILRAPSSELNSLKQLQRELLQAADRLQWGYHIDDEQWASLLKRSAAQVGQQAIAHLPRKLSSLRLARERMQTLAKVWLEQHS